MAVIKKFIIMTAPRSGSNMLVSMLNNHPEISCFGELMRKTPIWMKRDGYRGTLKILDSVDSTYKNDSVRFANAHDFIEAVYQTEKEKYIKGFKLHIQQHPQLLEQLVFDPEYKIIFLYRENILAQYSSDKIARLMGQGNASRGSEILHAKVKFKSYDFKKYVNKVNKEIKWANSLITSQDSKIFRIKYTQLIDNNRIRDLFSFLGADIHSKIESSTEKRNSSDILSRFENPDTAYKALQKLGYSKWLFENI